MAAHPAVCAITRIIGHTDAIADVCFSPDKLRLVTASHDRTARVWDVRTGDCLHAFRGHVGKVLCAAFSPDNKFIATGAMDGALMIWDACTYAYVRTVRGHTGPFFRIVFSTDGTRFATCSNDKTAKLWDAATGDCLCTFRGHTGWVTHVALSSDGARLATNSHDKTARTWNASTGACLSSTRLPYDAREDIFAYSPNYALLAIASSTTTIPVVEIIDILADRTISKIYSRRGPVTCVSFSYNNKWLAMALKCNAIKLWDVYTAQCVHVFQPQQQDTIKSLVFSSDNCRLVAGSDDGVLAVYLLKPYVVQILTLIIANRQRRATRLPAELWRMIYDDHMHLWGFSEITAT